MKCKIGHLKSSQTIITESQDHLQRVANDKSNMYTYDQIKAAIDQTAQSIDADLFEVYVRIELLVGRIANATTTKEDLVSRL